MKITDVEAIILRKPNIEKINDSSQDALIVRVHTDEGITGVGEVDSSPYVIKAVIDAPPSHRLSQGLRELVIGEDPFDIQSIWEKMYLGSTFYGRRGAAVQAMSGIDIALWDIMGKAQGVPIHKLLGGRHRDKVRAYASTLMPYTPKEAAAEAEKWAKAGFKAIKFGWEGFGQSQKMDVALAKAVREAVGDDVDIMLDIGFIWDAATGIQTVKMMEQYRPFWIEEPLPPDDLDGYAKLADNVDTRIAAGENESTAWGFKDLMDRGHVDVVQPDVTRAGGLTEAKRIAEMARLRNIPCVPHAWSTGIVKAASLQLIASIPNALFLEFCVWDTPLNKELVQPAFWIDKDGYVDIPTAPGLGVTLDEKVIETYRI